MAIAGSCITILKTLVSAEQQRFWTTGNHSSGDNIKEIREQRKRATKCGVMKVESHSTERKYTAMETADRINEHILVR
jgi:hypothetical protein